MNVSNSVAQIRYVGKQPNFRQISAVRFVKVAHGPEAIVRDENAGQTQHFRIKSAVCFIGLIRALPSASPEFFSTPDSRILRG
ncbi:hypothetical protein D3C75_1273840 [compost metagenome]